MKYKMIKNNRFSFYAIDNPWDIRGGRDGGGVSEEWGGQDIQILHQSYFIMYLIPPDGKGLASIDL